MEPVPETERMEEFRPTPILHLQEPMVYGSQSAGLKKPPTIRRSTDPTPHSLNSLSISTSSPIYQPRNTSPFARGHLRSKSSTGNLAPPMSRAQSLPGFSTAGHVLSSPLQRPASPRGSPSRVRTPRKPADEVFPGLPSRGLRNITESGDDLDDHIRRAPERSSSPILGIPRSASFTRSHRPSSPLRYAQQYATAGSTAPSTPSSVNSSPSYHSSKFNDAFLGTGYPSTSSYPGSFASSSVPSTPTSARSRSPSISSLETIPDSPDAEEAALEVERMAQLKVDADAADGNEDSKTKDTSTTRGRTLSTGFGRDKRKRWSVCGAERRGDLNLGTIWED